jgi:hypothetical protein
MRSLSRVFGACVLAVTMTSAGAAFAGDTATAELLFRQGLDAMKANKFKEACDAFAGSNEAERSVGTEINLGLCNEKQGKLATAWGMYRSAAGYADLQGQKERGDLARAEAAKLEPKLHKLNVTVKPPQPEGFKMTRNGQTVPNATLGTDVPLDPGDYVIEVDAKGKQHWKQSIKIVAGPGTEKLEIPQLEDAPVDKTLPPPPPGGGDYTPPQPARDGSTQRLVGYIAGGAGIVAAGVAVILEVVAVKESDKSDSNAAAASKINPVAGTPTFDADTLNKKSLSDSASSQHRAAKRDETGAIITGIGAVVLIGAGITLILTAPSSKSSASVSKPLLFPIVGRDNAGLGLVGTF